MAKHKFVEEFAFKTSPKVLYNYISTPGGLQQWFASKVTMDSSHNFNFSWDNEVHTAMLTSSRLNKSTRFDFIGSDEGNYLEFKLITSEIDGSTYLRITDCSDNHSDADLLDLWTGLIDELKEIVGG